MLSQPRITTPFNRDSTAAEVLAGVNLTGQRAVGTGGASGIGIETARALASAGAEVTLAVRNLVAGERAAADITAPRRAIGVCWCLTWSDRPVVRRGVCGGVGWSAPHPVNNAGIMAARADAVGRLGDPVCDQPSWTLRVALALHRRWLRQAARIVW